MSARWRFRDFLIVAGPLVVVIGVATLSALVAAASKAVSR